MKVFLKILLVILQELDLCVAGCVECFLSRGVSELAIWPVDLAVSIQVVGLTLEDFDLIFDLFQLGVALSGMLLFFKMSLAF
jgi:hypothetical protein